MGKALLFSEIFPPKVGGSGRLYWELYSRLPRDKFLVVAGEDPAAAEFDRSHDLQIIRLPLTMPTRGIRSVSNALHYWRTARKIRQIVREHGVTSIHCGRNLHEGFIGYIVKKMTGVQYLFYSHGEDINVSKTSRELAWMTRRVMKQCTLAIGSSQNTRQLLLNDWQMPESKVRVVYPGMDAGRFVPAPRDEALRAELGWKDRTVILTVGRLQKRKGHDMLIRSLSTIRTRFPQVIYAIIGTGEEEASLRELAQREGQAEHVQFLGGITDDRMVQCYQQCDLFALPNRTIHGDIEGFGMVLLEAQACGKPVLAGASGGTAETMQVPDTGRLVNCDTPESLTAAILELLSNPEEMQAMGSRGPEWAKRFDWPNCAESAEAIFREFRLFG